MAYYLSKANKNILDLFLPLIKEKKVDFSLELNKPELLLAIIRQSKGYEEYNWLHNRFYFVLNADKKHLDFCVKLSIIDVKAVEEEAYDVQLRDFFSIANIILLEKPDQVTFTNADLSIDEFNKLEILATSNGYSLTVVGHEHKLKKL